MIRSVPRASLGLALLFTLSTVGATESAHAFGRSKPKDPAPAPAPDPTRVNTFSKYRVMWSGDASTTATVGWASSVATTTQKIYYDTVDHGRQFAQYRYSRGVDAANNASKMNTSFARLSGLQPATVYYFVVADGNEAGLRYWFRTAPADAGERLSIIAGGDSRNNKEPRLNGNRLVAKLRPDVVMFGGDMTDKGSDYQWLEWFEDWQASFAADGRITPLIMTRGNHEASNEILVRMFDTPATVYYTTRIGGDLLRVYTLNSEASIAGTQTDWLRADLAQNGAAATWKFAQYHRPMRPHVSGKSDGADQYKHWAPLFQQYGMNLVSECDAHTVKQTWPIRPSLVTGSTEGFVRDDGAGTVYIGEGGWGAPLRSNDKNRPWTRDSGKFNHFQWIFVDANEVEVRTVQIDSAPATVALSDADRFAMPAGLKLWSPSNGSVLKLGR